MGPLLRYLVIALFVVLGASWLISSYQGCSKNDTTSIIDDIENGEDDDLWEEDLEEGDIMDGDADLSDNPDDLDAEITRLERELAGEFEADSPRPATKPNNPPKVTTVANPAPRKPVNNTNASPSKGAQFLVIAGSYSGPANAEAMVNRLEKMGYNDAEIVEFDYSKYFSVLAGRFYNEADARAIANELQEDGMEAYVHRKR